MMPKIHDCNAEMHLRSNSSHWRNICYLESNNSMSHHNLIIGKFSLGMGDRFAQEAEAQLHRLPHGRATRRGRRARLEQVQPRTPDHRVGAASVRAAAEAAIKKLGWKSEWHIDADHIRLETVDRFMSASDFFTIDVADSIGKAAKPEDVKSVRGQTSRVDRARGNPRH
jgi:hypothetical protein